MKADREARVQNLSSLLNKLKAMKTGRIEKDEKVVKMEEGPIGLTYLQPARVPGKWRVYKHHKINAQ